MAVLLGFSISMIIFGLSMFFTAMYGRRNDRKRLQDIIDDEIMDTYYTYYAVKAQRASEEPVEEPVKPVTKKERDKVIKELREINKGL